MRCAYGCSYDCVDGHVTETDTWQKKWRRVAPLERRIHLIIVLELSSIQMQEWIHWVRAKR